MPGVKVHVVYCINGVVHNDHYTAEHCASTIEPCGVGALIFTKGRDRRGQPIQGVAYANVQAIYTRPA